MSLVRKVRTSVDRFLTGFDALLPPAGSLCDQRHESLDVASSNQIRVQVQAVVDGSDALGVLAKNPPEFKVQLRFGIGRLPHLSPSHPPAHWLWHESMLSLPFETP